jgi:hypothetical protein
MKNHSHLHCPLDASDAVLSMGCTSAMADRIKDFAQRRCHAL